MKKLAVMAMPMDGLKTGLGLYMYRFIKNLALLNPPFSVTLFICKADRAFIQELSFPPNWDLKIIPSFCSKSFLNIAWIWWKSCTLPETYDRVYYPALNRRAPFSFSEKNLGFLHDLAEYHFPKKYSSLRNIYVKKVIAHQSRHVPLIIVNSQSTAQDVTEYYQVPSEKIRVNHLAPEEEDYYPIDRERACQQVERYFRYSPFLLYVSRLEHPSKNHLFLLSLFHALKKEDFSDLKLILIGSRWNNWRLIYKAIKRSPWKKDIYHYENVPQKDMKFFYSAAECYLHPSLWEGFGYPVVEAMRCGCPVLVAQNSSLPELVPSEESCFKDLPEAAKKVKALLKDKKHRVRYANLCQKYSQRFSMKRHVRRFLELIEESS